MIVELLGKSRAAQGRAQSRARRTRMRGRVAHPSEGESYFVRRLVGRSPKHIFETGTQHGKRVQANGGAKNYIVIMPDADMSHTVEALSTAAFAAPANVAWRARPR